VCSLVKMVFNALLLSVSLALDTQYGNGKMFDPSKWEYRYKMEAIFFQLLNY
jgi:hypothetical protein